MLYSLLALLPLASITLATPVDPTATSTAYTPIYTPVEWTSTIPYQICAASDTVLRFWGGSGYYNLIATVQHDGTSSTPAYLLQNNGQVSYTFHAGPIGSYFPNSSVEFYIEDSQPHPDDPGNEGQSTGYIPIVEC